MTLFFETKNARVLELAGAVAALVLDIATAPANALTPEIISELDAALDRIASAERFDQVVLCSGKPASFAHGPDPGWLTDHAVADDLQAYARHGQELCVKLSGMPIPSVAVIAGACLGSGLELAMACDYRVVLDRPAAVLGLPQIELGLLPCWGATQRLPRLIGLENSLKLLASARRLRPREAQGLGLVDAVRTESTPPEFLAEPGKRDWSAWPRRNWRQRWLEPYPVGRRFILRGARRVLSKHVPDDMPAPWEALEALRIAGEYADFTAGLAFEQEAIARLAGSNTFKNLLNLRLDRDRRRIEVPASTSAREVRAIGVVGATEAGVAFIRDALVRGCQVVLHDPDKTALGYASLKIHQALLEDAVRRGTLNTAAAVKLLRNFRGTANWEHFGDLDLVFDTVEDGRRGERFRHLDDVASPTTILASTSAADTAASLSSGLKHPRRVAVVHPAGPPGHEPVVELVGSEPVRVQEWIAATGKRGIEVADVPGLLVLRVWMPAFNEAVLLLHEGMLLARIDQAMDRFGMTPPPLEWMDNLGLDAIARLVEALQPTFAGRLTLESGFAEMARLGMRGAASGAGFYRHAGRQRRPNPQAISYWWAGPGEAWLSRAGLAVKQQIDLVQQRLTALMIIESFYCLQDKVVPDAATLDFTLASAGWAPHRGGPLTYARQMGADQFIAQVATLTEDFGPRFAPPTGLREVLLAR
jgi:3-hydroxyacyl-CoA dehydrogenase/enoyl-CoA hydratase/3-hydroxybutyryl-CoA epimerase